MKRPSAPTEEGDARLGERVFAALSRSIQGDVRFDALSRTIYATDASLYEITPMGVVLPNHTQDVVETVRVCREIGVPIVPRGGATGLAGGAVGSGIQVDLSRTMNQIGPWDLANRTVEVQPGVVLDDLNAKAAAFGMHFAPDVATSSRATIGGMIANNSCGARSVMYGRTVDHVAQLTVVLSSGEVETFGDGCVAHEIEHHLGRIRDTCFEEIKLRYPKILRSNGGYGLDRLGELGTVACANHILCGSEGTLGIIVSARLRLTPLPKATGLVVLQFHDVLQALSVSDSALKHRPSAVELVDHLIIDAGRSNAAISRGVEFLSGQPKAILIVELIAEDADSLALSVKRLLDDPQVAGASYGATAVLDPAKQTGVWELRRAGLGLLMSRPGDRQPYAFVEDSAVDPARLRDYIEEFSHILQKENVEAGYYAHASVGCIHVRPVLNMKCAEDVARMRRIAESVSDLARKYGGTMTGEHGDGILRSCWLEKMYGPRIIEAFREVKQLFDPAGLFNPNKIVDPLPMTEHLRFGPTFRTTTVKTTLDFSAHGGMAELAGMCSGVGQCRKQAVGTMCPSYMATRDETHTTRARANALRVALSNRGLLNGLSDPHLEEVMDLCLSCKACKTECPTGVDMARLKSEYLSHRILRDGAGAAARLAAHTARYASLASRWPRLANAAMQSSIARNMAERRYGFDRRVAPPRLATRTFRHLFRRDVRARQNRDTSRGKVVYSVDTWTNYFLPAVGMAVVRLLESAGYEVICPMVECCGRPAISQGLLGEAKALAEHNTAVLARYARKGVPIIATEPSCLSALVDEYPQLVRTRAAARVAGAAIMVESFLRRLLETDKDALRFVASESAILYHGHCHQKVLFGTHDATWLMRYAYGGKSSEIPAGCCGMAGTFGHEKRHYEVARAIGEDRLFPAIRDRADARVAVSGFSCRHQIEHHTPAKPRHIVEYLAESIAPPT